MNCFIPWGTEVIPMCAAPVRMARSRRRGGCDLRWLCLESGYINHREVKVKSSMARSLPVENLLPQNVGSIINYLQ